jgi:hypothetical protein
VLDETYLHFSFVCLRVDAGRRPVTCARGYLGAHEMTQTQLPLSQLLLNLFRSAINLSPSSVLAIQDERETSRRAVDTCQRGHHGTRTNKPALAIDQSVRQCTIYLASGGHSHRACAAGYAERNEVFFMA